MIEYKWNIVELERDASNGSVINVHWECTGLDGDTNNYGRVYSCTGLGPADVSDFNFIPFESLTKNQILEWLWALVDKKECESNIYDQIDSLNTPKTLSGLPW